MRMPLRAQHAVPRDVVEVMSADLRKGSVLPPAGKRAIDQPRIDVAQRLVIGAQPRRHAGPEAFDQHIGGFDQLVQDGTSRIGFQVDDDALLAAVAAAKENAHPLNQRRHPAGVVAALRVFDLDDFGAQVAQQHRADGAGQEARQIEDAGGVQGFHGGSLACVAGAWQHLHSASVISP